jgi:putative ATP-binding cassette transporter
MRADEEAAGKNPAALGKLGHKLLEYISNSPRTTLGSISALGLGHAQPWHIFLITLISALCGTGIIVLLNAEAEDFADRHYNMLLAIAFVGLLVAFQFSQRTLVRTAAEAIEEALHERRIAITNKLMRIDIAALERLSRGAVINGLARNFEVLSQSLVPLLLGLQSLILLCLMTGYLFWQSPVAGIVTVSIGALVAGVYLDRAGTTKHEMEAAALADGELSALADEVFSGFKEIRLNPQKEEALASEIRRTSLEVSKGRTKAADMIGALITTADSASYMLAAAVIFILPLLSGSSPTELARILTTVLFVLGPLGGTVKAAQQMSAAQVSLASVNEFEERLKQADETSKQTQGPLPSFNKLELSSVSYSYEGSGEERGFEVQSIDLSLRPQEVVFITGGNGSGKTTALRVLTGLYTARSGSIALNGRTVAESELLSYRQLFSVVFSDFHVFRKPYGLNGEQIASLEQYLNMLGIRKKLPQDLLSGYDPRALSTGQRKRLALALAMAEERPIIVLDEWAADQDPHYRSLFYEQLIPEFRKMGRAVVAVTHDDRFFHVADRRYHMEDNCLRRLN